MLFKGKYRTNTTHLREYDYSLPNHYSFTLCIDERKKIFGVVKKGVFIPSKAGEIIQDEWNGLSKKFKTIKLGEFVVMPDHVHGIISIFEKGGSSLFDIICYFKTNTAYKINKNLNRAGKLWQKSFYDRVIRDETEYGFAGSYIRNNPAAYSEHEKEKEWYEEYRKAAEKEDDL